MRRSYLLIVPSLLILALFLTAPGGPPPPVTFTHGIASGDVTHDSAVLWTRVNQEAKLTLEVSSDPNFDGKVIKLKVEASAENDFTVKALVEKLKPGDTYFYRFSGHQSVSEVGTFRTAGRPTSEMGVSFAYSGDSDGTKVGGAPFFNNFEVLDAIRLEAPDFWVYLGDTIYSDSGLRATGPAVTLDEYRDAYKVNRTYQALVDLLAAVSTYAIWDDHEVLNDFDGQTVDPGRYADGREAFLEYMPILDQGLLQDPACAGDPLYRVFHWGEDTDVIILDGRSCRSTDVTLACLVQLAPGVFQPDLAPTLPPPVRAQFNALLPDELKPLLEPTPPAGCLEAIFDPGRTMLGQVQKAAFKDALFNSDAKFKFVMNGPPIQQFYALPYDRWEGYGAERNEILNFIRSNNIDNVTFLSTDMHANLINEVFIDRFLDPAPIADEFVTGPIATNTFETEVRAFFGGGLLGEIGVAAFNQILDIVGVDCRDLNVDSYGMVKVDAKAGTATVTLKDDAGNPVLDKGPLLTGPCTKTIGP